MSENEIPAETATSDIASLKRKQIKKRIKETQALLLQLEAELEKREQERDHNAVDHIDDYMDDTEQSILSLWGYARKLLAGEKKS